MEKTQSKLTLKLKPQITEPDVPNNKRYRDWVFTLNNYQEEDINRIQQIESSYQIIGKEIAPTTGTPHLQGYIYLENAKTKQAVIKLFKQQNISNEVYVAPRYRKSTPEQASQYCKKDKQLQDIYEQGQIPDHTNQGQRNDIQQLKEDIKSGQTYETIQDSYTMYALRYGKSLQQLYETFRPKPKFNLCEEYTQLRPFQQQIIEYVKQQPDKRKILWIVDTTGASGKSELADHLMDNCGFIAINNGKTADMAYVWKGEHIVMDLSRTQQDHINYEAIEQLKNGRIMSSKYESCIKRYNRPHFIVMANYEPEMSAMSQDRWDIRYINQEFQLEGQQVNNKPEEGDTMLKITEQCSPIMRCVTPALPSPVEIIYSETDTPEQIIQTQSQEIKQLQDKILRLQHKMNQTSTNKKGAKATKKRSAKTYNVSLL